jgi:hypothetical protein
MTSKDVKGKTTGVQTEVTLPVNLTFSYDPEDPFAFYMKFNPSRFNEEVQWVGSLDLLRQGVHAPAGLADIQVYPIDKGQIAIRLEAEVGHSTTRVAAKDIKAFISAIDEEESVSSVTIGEAVEITLEQFLEDLGLYPYDNGPSLPPGWCPNCMRVHSGNGCGDA